MQGDGGRFFYYGIMGSLPGSVGAWDGVDGSDQAGPPRARPFCFVPPEWSTDLKGERRS
jgi:hypothetical protein